MKVKGEEVYLSGKGFGHGVGLSQEGAMNMCDLGYGFLDVLLFYYTQAHLNRSRNDGLLFILLT